ncbi:MAG: cyclic nucleotide-binding domain-containing protein [Acidobacteriota bacterium]
MKETYPTTAGNLSPTKLRNPLPRLDLTALKAIQTMKVYPKGSEFFMEGQSPEGIYILYAGRAELSMADNQGRKLVLGLAQPGEILGLSAVLSGKYYEETASAVVPSQTGFIKRRDFIHFLGDHPEAAFWVVQLLSEQVTSTFEQLSCVRRAPAKEIRQ